MRTIAPIPDKSRFIQAVDGKGTLAISDRSTPQPRGNEVLIKMVAAPFNPSDDVVVKNLSGTNRDYPTAAGREGAGLVVAAGDGILARFLLGKRVAVAQRNGGTWAEYTLAKATSCIPLRKKLTYLQGAMVVVNPLTVYAIFDYAKKNRHKALVNSAAAGPFGTMVRNYARVKNMPIINLVRRKNHVEQLQAAGEKIVLDTSEAGHLEKLREHVRALSATLFLDAIGGKATGDFINAAPQDGTILIYGNLSLTEPEISSFNLINDGKKIEGFLVSNWIRHANIFELVRGINEVQKRIPAEFATNIRKTYPMEEAAKAYAEAYVNASAGKTLLVMDPALIDQ